VALINGNGNNNVLDGTAAADWIYGRGGTDKLEGRGGNDYLDGEAGNDSLSGGAGIDVLRGSAGTYAGAGNDFLDGGTGFDATSYSGFNVVRGITADLAAGRVTSAAGSDRLVSIDMLFGTKFRDTILGSGRNDTLYAEAGNDRVDGRGGDDFLLGEAGRDVMVGGAGRDYLSGGDGSDRLTGGAGIDSFGFLEGDSRPGAGRVIVADFRADETISLFLIDANSATSADDTFRFIGASGFSGAGQLRAGRTSEGVLVQGNTDRDGAAEFEVLLADASGVNAGDFFL
jgi:Ca2+-binding RTX toxin-like protein